MSHSHSASQCLLSIVFTILLSAYVGAQTQTGWVEVSYLDMSDNPVDLEWPSPTGSNELEIKCQAGLKTGSWGASAEVDGKFSDKGSFSLGHAAEGGEHWNRVYYPIQQWAHGKVWLDCKLKIVGEVTIQADTDGLGLVSVGGWATFESNVLPRILEASMLDCAKEVTATTIGSYTIQSPIVGITYDIKVTSGVGIQHDSASDLGSFEGCVDVFSYTRKDRVEADGKGTGPTWEFSKPTTWDDVVELDGSYKTEHDVKIRLGSCPTGEEPQEEEGETPETGGSDTPPPVTGEGEEPGTPETPGVGDPEVPDVSEADGFVCEEPDCSGEDCGHDQVWHQRDGVRCEGCDDCQVPEGEVEGDHSDEQG